MNRCLPLCPAFIGLFCSLTGGCGASDDLDQLDGGSTAVLANFDAWTGAGPDGNAPDGNDPDQANSNQGDDADGKDASGDRTQSDNPLLPSGGMIPLDPNANPTGGGYNGDLRALDQSVVGERNRPVTVPLVGTTVLGGPLLFLIQTGPTHGTLSSLNTSPLNLATVRYTPAGGYLGSDEFTFVVSDGTQVSAPAHVAINVVAPLLELPSCCPEVYFDADRNFVVNGDRVLPVGFWNMYSATPLDGWAEYARYFNGLTESGGSAELNSGMQQYGLHLQAQAMLRIDTSDPNNPYIDASAIADAMCNRNIISWEVNHEPDCYPPPDLRGDVALQSEAIRAADGCRRPVMVTPQAGAGELFAEYARYTDYTAVQHYPSPSLELKSLAVHLDRVRGWIDSDPFVYNYKVAGYQPARYRLAFREPTALEVRAVAYLALVHGAKGLSFFSYSKGAYDRGQYGFPELGDPEYNVNDSPAFYADLKRIGGDLRRASPLFLAPHSTLTAVANHTDIHCAVWDVNGPLPGGAYLVWVNVADDPSPSFEYVAGERAEQIRAYVLTPDGCAFPRTQCNDGLDNDGNGLTDLADGGCFGLEDETEGEAYPLHALTMSPSTLYLKRIYTGIWNQPEPIDRVRILFDSAPAGAQYQFALYADQWRDRAPSQKVYESAWAAIPTSGGWVEASLSSAVTLEHTREYFLVVRVNRDGVLIQSQDVRFGVRAKPGTNTFADSYPPLHQGRRVTSTITLRGEALSAYCATRSLDDQACTAGTVTGNRITDTFEPYAVHIYQLIP